MTGSRRAWAIAAAVAMAALAIAGGALLLVRSLPSAVTPPVPASVPPTLSVPPTATIAAWPKLTLVKRWSGFSSPLGLTHAGDGSGRIFVIEQGGVIRVVRDGRVVRRPFLDISDLVASGGERGLLGLAFPPGDAAKGHFYIDYTDLAGDTHIARVGLTPDPDVADRASVRTILKIRQPFANHNGGQLAFGPDGYLYIGMGDGGSGGDPGNRAQNPRVLLGKLLRIDVEDTDAYKIPPDNPFVGRPGWRGEIWALGLRNPWRFSFDRVTGDLWIGDVGQDAWEEIDFQPAGSPGGRDYGWPRYEGDHVYDASRSLATKHATPPVTEYPHPFGECITGGYVGRGDGDPSLTGIYFFGDFVKGQIFGLRREDSRWVRKTLLETNMEISSFGEDEAGTLYVVDYGGGVVYRLR